MDCVSKQSKKKVKGARAPRARGKRASYHACSSIEEPTNLDPLNTESLTLNPTDISLDNRDAKSETENDSVNQQPVVCSDTGIHLPHIGESSTDFIADFGDDFNDDTNQSNDDEQDESVNVDDTKQSSDVIDEDVEEEESENIQETEINLVNSEKPESLTENSVVDLNGDASDSENDTEGKDIIVNAENTLETENNKKRKDILTTDIVSETNSRGVKVGGKDCTLKPKDIVSDIEDQTERVAEKVDKISETENKSDTNSEDKDKDSEDKDKDKVPMMDLTFRTRAELHDDDGMIHFEAKPRTDEEDLSHDKETEGVGVSDEKSKIENDVRVADKSHHEHYPVFSEYVDIASIGEDIKDEGSESGEIEAGEDILVQYMKRGQYKQLKSSLRNGHWGLTSDVRGNLWYNLCHYLHKADDSDMFSELAEDLFSPGDFSDIGMPSFVDTQYLNSYHLTAEGIHTVKQIVCVLGHSCPDIIYSPVLFSMLSVFLHYMDKSHTYNCLYSLLRSKDSSFLPTTKVSYEASKLVMRDLAKKHAKRGYVYLVRNCTNIDQMFDTWIWWIFEDLPMIFLVRVLDCYLQEGIKIFYRISLAILILFAKINAKKSSPKHNSPGGNILLALRQFIREMPVSVYKLLKTSFSIKGLSRKELRKLQVKHEMFINSHKNVNSYDNQPGNRMTLSKSFSGPMILQNLGSDTLTVDMLYALLTWLPTRYAICQPELLYTSEEHGTSLVTLYQRVENYQPTVIIIKTTDDEVFGAFCSTYWRERRQKSQLLSYFGTGETFIFTLAPEKKKYDWVGLTDENIPNTASMFQAGDRSILTIGGGHGEAIYLDETMLHCRSVRCDTFNNEPLSQAEDFVCKVVEVYGFQ